MRLVADYLRKLKNEKGEYEYTFLSKYSVDIEKKAYILDIKEIKSKRSLQQNSMLWANIKSIAKHQNEDIIKVYCDVLESADCKSEFILLPTEASEELRKCYRAMKFVNVIEMLNPATGIIQDYYQYQCFIGSSKFNVKEMNRLIEITLNIKADLGIFDTVDAESTIGLYE